MVPIEKLVKKLLLYQVLPLTAFAYKFGHLYQLSHWMLGFPSLLVSAKQSLCSVEQSLCSVEQWLVLLVASDRSWLPSCAVVCLVALVVLCILPTGTGRELNSNLHIFWCISIKTRWTVLLQIVQIVFMPGQLCKWSFPVTVWYSPIRLQCGHVWDLFGQCLASNGSLEIASIACTAQCGMGIISPTALTIIVCSDIFDLFESRTKVHCLICPSRSCRFLPQLHSWGWIGDKQAQW